MVLTGFPPFGQPHRAPSGPLDKPPSGRLRWNSIFVSKCPKNGYKMTLFRTNVLWSFGLPYSTVKLNKLFLHPPQGKLEKFAPPVGPKKSPWDSTFLGITAKQIRGTWKVHFIFFPPLSSVNGDQNFQKLENQAFHWFNKRPTHALIGWAFTLFLPWIRHQKKFTHSPPPPLSFYNN